MYFTAMHVYWSDLESSEMRSNNLTLEAKLNAKVLQVIKRIFILLILKIELTL